MDLSKVLAIFAVEVEYAVKKDLSQSAMDVMEHSVDRTDTSVSRHVRILYHNVCISTLCVSCLLYY